MSALAVRPRRCAGITGVTGYEGGPPQMLSNAIGDPVSALNACFASLVGVFEQERRGEGVSVDLSHVEGLLPLNAEALLDYTLNGRVQEPGRQPPSDSGAPRLLSVCGR